MEKRNCAYFGKGLVLNKYTGARGKSGSNDANAEYIARLRRIFVIMMYRSRHQNLEK